MISRTVFAAVGLLLLLIAGAGTSVAAEYSEQITLNDGAGNVSFNQSLGTLNSLLVEVNGRADFVYTYRNISSSTIGLQCSLLPTFRLDLPWHTSWWTGTGTGTVGGAIQVGQSRDFAGAFGYQCTYDSSEDNQWPGGSSFVIQLVSLCTATPRALDFQGNELPFSTVVEFVTSSIANTGTATITYNYTPVPEPSSIVVLLCGIGGATSAIRRRTA